MADPYPRSHSPLTVSVVVATIPPREQLLQRALRSVAKQIRKPDEIVVQLDEAGEGAGPTRNRAILRARGDYVAVLDDDDELLPDHLARLMASAEATGADVIYSWFEHVDWPDWTPQRPDPLAVMYGGQLRHPLGVPFGVEQAAHMRRYAFIPACLLLRRDLVTKVGGYPPPDSDAYRRHGGCEDWALLVALLDEGASFVHVPARTWRLHHGGNTGGRDWRKALA